MEEATIAVKLIEELTLAHVLLFVFAVIGMTQIIVTPATILQPFRDWSTKNMPKWFNDLVGCHQCCGTWCGFLMGWILISSNPFIIFACGMAGSFVSLMAIWHINLVESISVYLDSVTEFTISEDKDG